MTKYFRWMVFLAATAVAMEGGLGSAQSSPGDPSTGFPPLDQWKSAVLAADATALRALYSTDPADRVMANGVTVNAEADMSFWLGLKAQSLKLEIVRMKARPGVESIIFKTEVRLPNGRILSVTDGQGWRMQGGQWRLAGVERADDPQLAQPSDMNKNIYPADADAHAEIKEAEERAAAGHKRVLLVFGANWCFDCHVLDLAFRRPDLASALAGYEVVPIDLGDDEKKNADILKQFDVTLDKGIPTLAVAESDGSLVVSQKNGEFEDARSLTPEVLLEFLNKWKSPAR